MNQQQKPDFKAMNQWTEDLIKEHLSFNCSICLQDYNSTDHYPYEICINSHSVCKYCLQNHLLTSISSKCPQCRQTISNKSQKKFPKRLTNQIVSIIEEVKRKDDEVLKMIQQTGKNSLKKQKKLTELILEKQRIQNENKKLCREFDATLSQINAQRRQLYYSYFQSIQVQKKQNIIIKIILIFLVLAIIHMILSNPTLSSTHKKCNEII